MDIQKEIDIKRRNLKSVKAVNKTSRVTYESLGAEIYFMGLERGYEQALEDMYRQINSIFKKHATSDADPLNMITDKECDICDIFCNTLGDERARQILTIPEEE